MSDRTYLILRSRIERRFEKPRILMQHMALFSLYTVIFGTMSIISRSMGNMDGIFYWTIFAWSVLVGMHTIYSYLRSGAWAATREQAIQEEILEAVDEFAFSDTEMMDLHQRLSEDIQARSGIFRKLARIGAGYFIAWPGSMLILYMLQLLIVGRYGFQSGTYPLLEGLYQIWQPLSLLGTFVLSMFLIPWQQIRLQGKSQEEMLKAYQGKGKRLSGERLAADLTGEDGEFLTDYDEPHQPGIRKTGIEPNLG